MKRKTFGVFCAFVLVTLVFWINVLGVDHVHLGSKNNPLDGLTVTWRGESKYCMIKWGYKPSYEKGEYKIKGRKEIWPHKRYLYDYTFPAPEPSATIHMSFQECKKKKPTDHWSRDYTFKTSVSVESESFTFIAGGDSRGKLLDFKMKDWGRMAGILDNTHADFYLYLGDIIYMGGWKMMWEKWYKEGEDFISRHLIYHSIGNHETILDPKVKHYLKQFVLPRNGNSTERYYSFEFGNAVFIILDTEFNRGVIYSKKENKKLVMQTEWLKKEIKKYRGENGGDTGVENYKEWVIVAFHRPFFTIDYHMGEMTKKINKYDYRENWWKNIFDKYGIDVIINGHTHCYMRSVPLLVVGNGKDGGDLTFDNKGLPNTPAKQVKYGNKPGQGRLQVVTGGYGVPLKKGDDLMHKGEWYVDNYKSEFHYCIFTINGKKLTMEIRNIDNNLIDSVTITH